MRVLICGDRNWKRSDIMETIFDTVLKDKLTVLIEGEAQGADRISRNIAQDRGIPYEAYFADWKRYGKGAGYKRNLRMLEEGKPDLIVAFYTDIEESKGTKMMINLGVDAGIQVLLVSECCESDFEVTEIKWLL